MLRAAEGQYSELMKKREGAAGSSILTQPGAPECSRSRLSLPLLKDDENFSSSHRGHPLIQTIQSLRIRLRMWNLVNDSSLSYQYNQ